MVDIIKDSYLHLFDNLTMKQNQKLRRIQFVQLDIIANSYLRDYLKDENADFLIYIASNRHHKTITFNELDDNIIDLYDEIYEDYYIMRDPVERFI